MRYMINGELGWLAVPVLFIVGAAYVWIADRMIARKVETSKPVELAPSMTRAA